MSSRSKRTTNVRIQKEQVRLVKIQNELEGLLGKVNETLNELQVEELQLKSSAVTSMHLKRKCEMILPHDGDPEQYASTSAKTRLEQNESLLTEMQLPMGTRKHNQQQILYESDVNQQEIDLDMFVHQTRRNFANEEEEEESD